ncbi:hypothetical protein L6164_014638 [Bauhinia variegata]|uniref:Uncharacterized protein n=1 Tax=Bauhinia variegata TaxID=167791 RepID=A0ACB9NJE3_BAUVA|nr:hypothetical protein L6164_014638 [Bauhinia variegata]
MVAISLYRGNFHRVPDVPRRWLMPNPKLSLKDFKSLLARRSKALSRLRATTTTTTTTTAKLSNPNPSPNCNPSSLPNGKNEVPTVNASSLEIQLEPVKVSDNGEGPSRQEEYQREPEVNSSSVRKPVDEFGSFIDSKTDVLEKAPDPINGDGEGRGGDTSKDRQNELIRDKVGLPNEKAKRKRAVEVKLQVLNAKKHNLVLVLKQILNAEEELKRRNSMQAQGIAIRPSVPLQTDGTNDTGSMIRHMTPRTGSGSEANLVGDVEGGEADDLSNHNVHSSESPLRRTPSAQQIMVSRPPRASVGITGSPSPSRFALSGHQGNPTNPPSVSVSGTSYIASSLSPSPSPSPAASGGTSVFRDARHPSPWN